MLGYDCEPTLMQRDRNAKMPKRTGRGIAAFALSFILLLPVSMAEAHSQASKTGLGVSRQKASAASGRSGATASSGTLSVGALTAAVGVVAAIGIAIAIGSGGGASSGSSTN